MFTVIKIYSPISFDFLLKNIGNIDLDSTEAFNNLPVQTPGALSERAPPTPWHDDYDEMAPSVGPVRF